MNKNMKYGIIIFVFILAIGFAAVTTNLLINGTASLGFVSSDFDVYFSSAIPEDDGTATIDNVTKKTITYSTKTLSKVGDQAVLDYIVTNASTVYNAKCTVTFTIDSGASEYVTITKTGFTEDTPTVVNAQSTQSGRILITLKKRSMEPIQFSFTVTINVEPEGRTEGAESGQVNRSDETPAQGACVPSGYYGLQCSCDDHAIAWQDGPYYDANNNAMNATRVRDITYPPANTYICGCENGTTGYVVNTGILLESECPVEEPVELDEHQKLIVKLNNRPTGYQYSGYYDKSRYTINVPAYDDENGTTERLNFDLDIYNQVNDTIVSLDEVEWNGDGYTLVQNSNRIEYIGATGNKYSYRLHYSSINDQADFQITLREKSNPNALYSSNDYFDIYLEDRDYINYEDENGNTYPYYQGRKPWATWFMNEGRNIICWEPELC